MLTNTEEQKGICHQQRMSCERSHTQSGYLVMTFAWFLPFSNDTISYKCFDCQEYQIFSQCDNFLRELDIHSFIHLPTLSTLACSSTLPPCPALPRWDYGGACHCNLSYYQLLPNLRSYCTHHTNLCNMNNSEAPYRLLHDPYRHRQPLTHSSSFIRTPSKRAGASPQPLYNSLYTNSGNV